MSQSGVRLRPRRGEWVFLLRSRVRRLDPGRQPARNRECTQNGPSAPQTFLICDRRLNILSRQKCTLRSGDPRRPFGLLHRCDPGRRTCRWSRTSTVSYEEPSYEEGQGFPGRGRGAERLCPWFIGNHTSLILYPLTKNLHVEVVFTFTVYNRLFRCLKFFLPSLV